MAVTTSRRLWILAYVTAGAVLIAGVAVQIRHHADGGREQTEAAPAAVYAAMPFEATMSQVSAPVTTVGGSMMFSVGGFSKSGIDHIDLYDGARMVARSPGPKYSSEASLSAPALSTGEHLVHAELVDGKGHVTKTAPSTVGVAPGPGGQRAALVTLLPGETREAVAKRLGLAPDAVSEPEPPPAGAGPDEPEADGPEADGPEADGPEADGPEASDAATVVVTVDAQIEGGDDRGVREAVVQAPAQVTAERGAPAAPTTKVDGCSVKVSSTKGATIFRAGSGTSGWVKAGSGTAVIDPMGGSAQSVFARDPGGDSSTVSVQMPPACQAATGWTGNASIVNGTLNLDQPNGSTFLYLTQSSKRWIRIPSNPNETFKAGVHTDIANMLPALAGRSLDLQVWKAGEFPKQVASGKLQVPEGQTLNSVVGEPAALTLGLAGEPTRTAVELGSTDEKLTFAWDAASDSTDRIQWQLLAGKPSPADGSLAPTQLLATGQSLAIPNSRVGRRGTFVLDTADIIRRPGSLPTKSGEQAGGAGQPGALKVLKPPVAGAGATLPSSASFGALVPAGTGDPVVQAASILPKPGDTVWVRALANPTKGGPTSTSNSYPVTLPVPQSTETGVDFTVDSLTIDPGRAPNPTWTGCQQVTVPWAAGEPSASLENPGMTFQRDVARRFYPVSGSYCARDFPPPTRCDEWYCKAYYAAAAGVAFVIDLAAQAWDIISYAYNSVITAVVDTFAKYNPICLTLAAADEGAGDGCAAVASVVAGVAVTAVLASFGLPPSLPTSAQVKALADGEVALLAVELMKQAGIPCDSLKADPAFADAITSAGGELGAPSEATGAAADPCLAVAKILISSVKKQVSSATAAASGLPYFDIPGFEMAPDKRGLADPLLVQLSAHVTEADADATGAVCRVQMRDPANKLDHGPTPYAWETFVLTEDEPLDGTGSWSGAGTSQEAAVDPVAALTDANIAVETRSVYPSPCDIPPATATKRVAPPDP